MLCNINAAAIQRRPYIVFWLLVSVLVILLTMESLWIYVHGYLNRLILTISISIRTVMISVGINVGGEYYLNELLTGLHTIIHVNVIYRN